MFESQTGAGWAANLLWLGGIALAGFLVSWVVTDRLGIRRTFYIGALTIVTVGLTAGYLLWSGASIAFWTNAWAWGVVGAVMSGAFVAVAIGRAPITERTGPPAIGSYLWQSVVYGATEGLLLSVLPVVVTWQALADLGWTEGWRAFPAGAVALLAGAAVILIHHLGYRGYRSRRMIFPVVGCSVLSLAYLLTGSPIAAMGGHIILHVAMERRRMELPPHAPTVRADAQMETPERPPALV